MVIGNLQEFSNFKGEIKNLDNGLIPQDPKTGVYSQHCSNVTVDDGTIRTSPGCSRMRDEDDIDIQDSSSTGIVNGCFSFKKFPSIAFPDGTPVIGVVNEDGSCYLYSPQHNEFKLFKTDFAPPQDGDKKQYSYAVYKNLSSTRADDFFLFLGSYRMFEMWNGGYDYVNTVDIDSFTIAGEHTKYFDNGYNKSVMVNGNIFTYTNYSSVGKTFTGVVPNPVGILSAGDFVIQSPESDNLTSRYYDVLDATSSEGRTSDTYSVYKDRLVAMSSEGERVYLSELNHPFNFTIVDPTLAAEPIIVSSGFGDDTITATGNVGDIMVLLKRNGVQGIKISANSSGLQTSQYTYCNRPGSGIVSSMAYANTDNGLFFISKEGQLIDVRPINALYPDSLESVSLLPEIDNVLKYCDNSKASCIFYRSKRYISTCDRDIGDSNNKVIIYDELKKSFSERDWKISSWFVHPLTGRLYGFKTGDANPVLIDDAETSDFDGIPVIREWVSPRHNFGAEFNKKRFKTALFSGKIGQNTDLNVELSFNSGEKIKTFTIKGDGTSNDKGTYLITTENHGPYGTHNYGEDEYSGTISYDLDKNVEDSMRGFMCVVSLPNSIEPYDVIIRFWDETSNGRWAILSYAFDVESMNTVNQGSIIS